MLIKISIPDNASQRNERTQFVVTPNRFGAQLNVGQRGVRVLLS